jgi:hypothetical protein
MVSTAFMFCRFSVQKCSGRPKSGPRSTLDAQTQPYIAREKTDTTARQILCAVHKRARKNNLGKG